MIVQNQIRNFSATFRDSIPIKNRKRVKEEKGRPFKWERVCSFCGAAELIPAGSCHICRNCGAGTGCS